MIMGYTTIWIEGEENLRRFCVKRFKEKPSFVETIGRAGGAKINLVYKWREDKQRYVDMYLLFMPHPNGRCYDINDERKKSYEEIRSTKGSILDV